MEKIQKRRILWRVPLIIAFICAVSWTVWYFTHGKEMLISDKVEAGMIISSLGDATLLPALSRWWDIPAVALYMVIFILFFSNKKLLEKIRNSKNEWFIIATLFPISVLVLSAIFGFWTGFTHSFIGGVAFALILDGIVGAIFILYKLVMFSSTFKFWPRLGNWIAGLENKE